MKVKLTISILTAIILILILTMVITANQHVQDLNKASSDYNYQQEQYLENISEQIENYNELYADYNELNKNYQELVGSKGFYEGWERYQCTGYTSLDEGCNNISASGINILKWKNYFNFCAVDPTLIPFGSIVLVKFQTGIEPFLAVDVGGKIKGKHIDLYFGNDLKRAFRLNKELEVKVIK